MAEKGKIGVVYVKGLGAVQMITDKGGNTYAFNSVEEAKEGAALYTKNQGIRQGFFLVYDVETSKILSTFNFPPPPPLEGWVDMK